jgi:zinc transport system substrate-binding protein
MSLSRRILLFCLVLCAGLARAEPLTVGVSLLPMQTFVERIGGEHVRAVVLVPPGKSPASYEPTPKQMQALAAAPLYFRIGVPFEKAWLPRLQQALPGLRLIDLRDGLPLRPIDLPGSRDGHAHGKGEADPHTWLAPPLVMRMADRIRDALIAVRPELRADFERNHERFFSELQALDSELRQRLAGKQQRHFMVFHPSWGYFADAYGLTQIPIEAGWKEPGPQTLARLIDEAKRRQIRVIFVQQQFSRREAETVASAIGGEVLAVDPLAPDYLANLRRVGETFARVLQ